MSRLFSWVGTEWHTFWRAVRRYPLQSLLVVGVAASILMLGFARIPFAANPVEGLLVVLVIASPFLLLPAVLHPLSRGFRFAPVDVAWLLTVGFALVSFAWTWGGFHPTRPAFNILALAGFYLLLRVLDRRILSRHATLVAALVTAAATSEAVAGLIQRSGGLPMRGHFENANALGMFLALAVPVAISQTLTRRYGFFYRLGFVLLAALFLWVIVLTRCRTAMVAVGFVLPAMALFHARALLPPRSRVFPPLAGATMLVVCGGMAAVAWPLYELSPISVWGRLLAWKMGLQMLADAPLVGVGFDGAWRQLMDYQAAYFARGGGNELERLAASPIPSLFNDYLETAVDYGLLGLTVFIPFWCLAALTAFRAVGRQGRSVRDRNSASGRPLRTLLRETWRGLDEPTAGFGFGGAVLVFLLMTLTYSTSHFRVLMVFFALAMGLIVGLVRRDTGSIASSRRSGRRSRSGLVAVSIAICALSVPFLWHAFLEKAASRQHRIARAEWDAGQQVAALARLETAYPALVKDGDFLEDYGRRLREAGQTSRALPLLEQAQRLRSDPFALEEIARTRAALGDLGGAIASAEQARAMLPWRLTARQLLADYYEATGDREMALAVVRELLVTPMKVGNEAGLDLKKAARARLLEWAQESQPKIPEDVDTSVPDGLARALLAAGENAQQLVAALRRVEPPFRAGLEFLIVHMPESDLVSLPADYLLENVRLAYAARDLLPCVRDTPEDVFLNYVLPYSQAAETRDPWRRDFHERFAPLVSDCPSVEAAVVRLNEEIYERLGVGFEERGRKVSQSPFESIASGAAHCYGLSILLADACRAVGIPARITTIPSWVGISGGHGWVEVYDSGRWRFIGAFDRSPLDDTWFRERASQTDPGDPRHRIYAASFARTGIQTPHFGGDVWWTDVTSYYLNLPSLVEPSTTR